MKENQVVKAKGPNTKAHFVQIEIELVRILNF